MHYKSLFFLTIITLISTSSIAIAGGGNGNKKAPAVQKASGFKFNPPSDALPDFFDSSNSFDASPTNDNNNNNETSPKLEKTIRRQPDCQDLSLREISVIFKKARDGDRKAQDSIIELNYWGFLPYNQQASLWGEGLRNGERLDPLVWKDIEARALECDMYAYAVIDAYAHHIRWHSNQSKLFSAQFPRLFKKICDGAKEGSPNDLFSLGVIYKQLSPKDTGLAPVKDTVKEAFFAFEKAAQSGHILAGSALGQLAWMSGPQGRNDIECLRWFLPSKANKVSQDALKKILRRVPCETKSEFTFHEEMDNIQSYLGTALERPNAQVGVHDKSKTFGDNQFAIPELSDQYKVIVDFQEDLSSLLTELQATSYGFLVSCVTPTEIRDRGHMMGRQTQPAAFSLYTFENKEFCTFGETNVRIASRFIKYLKTMDQKFDCVDDILKRDSKSYTRRLEKQLDKLKELRLACLKLNKELNESPSGVKQAQFDEAIQKFKKQESKYEDKKQVLSPVINKIKEEREMLSTIKENIKCVLGKANSRNKEFLEELDFIK